MAWTLGGSGWVESPTTPAGELNETLGPEGWTFSPATPAGELGETLGAEGWIVPRIGTSAPVVVTDPGGELGETLGPEGWIVPPISGTRPVIDLDFSLFAFSQAMSFTRATSATVTDHLGVVNAVKIGELRHQGLRRVENLAPNGDAAGAVAGAPGTLPTGWSTSLSGVSIEVVSTGVESGIGYADLRLFGTTTGTIVELRSSAATTIPATVGQVFTLSQHVAIVGGSMNNISTINDQFIHRDSGGAFLTGSSSAHSTLTGSLASCRDSVTGTMAASSAYIQPDLVVVATGVGVVIDITLRVGGVQIERGSAMSEYVSTSRASSPVYHGAFVDGVKYFATDASGVAIPEATREGVLIEEARTNLAFRSMTPGFWNPLGLGSYTANQVGIDGIPATAATATESTVSEVHHVLNTATPATTVGQTYCITLYVKPGTADRCQIAATSVAFPATFYVNYSLVGAGSILAQGASVVSASITLMPNGFYRAVATCVATGTGGGTPIAVAFINSDTASRLPAYVGTGLTLIIGGGQFELGTFPTSILPTVVAAVTRNADNLSFTLPGSFSATQGTWLVDSVVSRYADRIALEGAGTTGVTIGANAAATGVRAQDRHGTSRGDFGATVTVGTRSKVGMAYSAAAPLASAQGATLTNGATPAQADYGASAYIGSRDGTSLFHNFTIRAIRWYSGAKSQAQLNALTAP